jgi:hypothetical protein
MGTPQADTPEPRMCAHADCNCTIQEDLPNTSEADEAEYCSEYCAGTGASESGTCRCGHAECFESWPQETSAFG